MKGVCLRIYLYENQKKGAKLLYEWILEKAKEHQFLKGSAFRAIAGFGRQGSLHEEHFFELGGNVPVELELIGSKEKIQLFLKSLHEEKIELNHSLIEAEFFFSKND